MVFEVKNMHKTFGENHVLKGIDFSASSGTAFGLLGRNGAGKTTTIRIIMGVFPPDNQDCQILLDGRPLNRNEVKIGYLPEERGLYPRKEIMNQLVYLGQLRGMTKKAAKTSIAYWLERLGMEEYANKKLDTLSKGNQQKIQLAAALVNDPELLILDEPFSGLDPVNATLLKDVVKEKIKEGKIVLFSSHQMNYVEEFCDSIAILHHGEIVLEGSISEIKRSYDRSVMLVQSPANEQVQRYCEQNLQDVVEKVRLRSDGLRVKLHQSEQKNQFMQLLASSGMDVDSIGVFEPSLNDIFVQYAKDDEADEGGEANETA